MKKNDLLKVLEYNKIIETLTKCAATSLGREICNKLTPSFSFDIVNGTNPDITSVKSWAHIYLDSEWKKYTLTPSNLLKADSIGGNVGWENVKTGITNISIFGGTGGEFWIDDIEFFGYENFAIKE